MDYIHEYAKLLSGHIPSATLAEISEHIKMPPDYNMGHFAYSCFKLAKEMKKAPAIIASEIAEAINSKKPDWLDRAAAVNAYINIFISRQIFMQTVLENVLKHREKFGSSNLGANEPFIVEYSSPNIAKYFSVGNMASTIIGHALSNILEHVGYKVIRLNFLGDWGTQFGKLISAYKKWGDKNEIDKTGIEGLTKLYVKFHEEADKDDSLNDEARAWLLKMQKGDDEGLSLWRWICDLSIADFSKVYKRLDINFDSIRGESYYNDGQMDKVAKDLGKLGLLTESEGAKIVDLEAYNMPPCLILRSDGGTLYPTRDIAAAIDRYDTYKFKKCIIVTGNEQILHFAQWMKVLELMGYPWAKDLEHIPYGFYRFESGKMSARRGNVIIAEDLFDEAVKKTLEIIKEKNPGLENKEKVAEEVGIGAIIFYQMYNNRIKDVMFSWDRMLSFEGETGPYVQYAHARACSVLEKAGFDAEINMSFDPSLICDDESFEIARILYTFPERIAEAANKYEPYLISRHLMALAQAFNKFYHAHTVLTEDMELRKSRIALTYAVKLAASCGLALLGIKSPEKM